jgi:hypothetical protein
MVLGFSRFNLINLIRPQRAPVTISSLSRIMRFLFTSLYVLFVLRTRPITFISLHSDNVFRIFCLREEANNFLRSVLNHLIEERSLPLLIGRKDFKGTRTVSEIESLIKVICVKKLIRGFLTSILMFFGKQSENKSKRVFQKIFGFAKYFVLLIRLSKPYCLRWHKPWHN